MPPPSRPTSPSSSPDGGSRAVRRGVTTPHPECTASTRFRLTALLPHIADVAAETEFLRLFGDEGVTRFRSRGGGAGKAGVVAPATRDQIRMILAGEIYDPVFEQRGATHAGRPSTEPLVARPGKPCTIFAIDGRVEREHDSGRPTPTQRARPDAT